MLGFMWTWRDSFKRILAVLNLQVCSHSLPYVFQTCCTRHVSHMFTDSEAHMKARDFNTPSCCQNLPSPAQFPTALGRQSFFLLRIREQMSIKKNKKIKKLKRIRKEDGETAKRVPLLLLLCGEFSFFAREPKKCEKNKKRRTENAER